MSTEMQDHSHDMDALTKAQAYIKEVETREQQLKDDNANLAARLQAKQAELDDQPAEFKALKVDLQQAELRITFHKDLKAHAEEHADRLQRKLDGLITSQTAADDAARKIERLERDLADHEAAILQLVAATRKLVDHHDAQRERDLELIKEKEDKIIALISLTNQLELEKAEALADADNTVVTCDELTQVLEAETSSAATLLNRNSLRLQSSDQLYAAVSTELNPLNDFYANAYSILSVYQSFFHSLSDPACTVIPDMPSSLVKMLDAACHNLGAFQCLSTAMQSEPSLAHDTVRAQLSDMAKGAAHIHASLETVHKDLSGFLDRLRANCGQFNKPRTSAPSRVSFAFFF